MLDTMIENQKESFTKITPLPYISMGQYCDHD